MYTCMPKPSEDLQSWIVEFCEKPTAWKNIFRKAVLKYRGKNCFSHSGHPPSLGGTLPLPTISCDECGFSCCSFQQLTSHKFNIHGYVNPLRLRISDPTCISCGTNFHTRHRLFRHLTSRPTKNKCSGAYDFVAPCRLQSSKSSTRQPMRSIGKHISPHL